MKNYRIKGRFVTRHKFNESVACGEALTITPPLGYRFAGVFHFPETPNREGFYSPQRNSPAERASDRREPAEHLWLNLSNGWRAKYVTQIKKGEWEKIKEPDFVKPGWNRRQSTKTMLPIGEH
jgi:hypothetical protein